MKSKISVLLIQPWIYDFAAYDFWIRPQGLLKLATMLKPVASNIDLIDCLDRTHPQMTNLLLKGKYKDKKDGRGNFFKTFIRKPKILSFVPRRYGRYGITKELFIKQLSTIQKPDLICISSGMTYWYPGIESVLSILNDYFPHSKIVLGGIYPTLIPQHAKKRKYIDEIFPGESLSPFYNYLNEKFPQITVNSNWKNFNPNTHLIPNYSLLRDASYAVIETSIGCPFHCKYCASNLIHNKLFQFNIKSIIEQLDFLSTKKQTKNIAFYDDALFYKPEIHIKPLLKTIIERKYPFHFHTPNGLFPNYIDSELADFMFKSNFKTIRLSLDTFSLKRANDKGNKKTHILDTAFKNLIKAGFINKNIEVYILIGLPEQNIPEIEEATEYVKSLHGTIRLAQFSPVPGTQDWKKAIDLKIIQRNSDPLFQNPTVYAYKNPYLSIKEYEQIKSNIYSQ